MLKVSQKFAGFLANGVMVAQALAALFFGYLWVTRRNQVQPVGIHAPDANHLYTDDTITAYAALAIASVALAMLQYFIRKSPRLMRLFTE
ncbi:hypothetical protein KB206_08425 [Microvirga sp. STS02]|uniref:hypothetical protein n=1 Tax=Hymenobacter negativus TaxID=2795026 RepID=UPI0018DD7AD0|nr:MULTISPECIES: hypothetical protein [Bacteria]MBH8568903.1 hypothetical protein [Hymenobacter negativus]MBR7208638.1 hypothetical protein [Microvirga sp. STS02]